MGFRRPAKHHEYGRFAPIKGSRSCKEAVQKGGVPLKNGQPSRRL